MILLKLIIAYTAFSVMFAYRNYWQIQETSNKGYPRAENIVNRVLTARNKWHKWQFALQIFIGACIGWAAIELDQSWLNALGHGLLFGATFWLIFDTLLGYLLTRNILHVDSNGIGTIYKNITFKVFSLIWEKTKSEKEDRYQTELSKKGQKIAGIFLLISKVLLFIISILLTIL